MTKRIAVIGGGWAGCAAAVQATAQGHRVALFEMAGQLGGRARRVELNGWSADNGQHILIGAYTECLRLLHTVGVDPAQALHRTPLRLAYPDGSGLYLQPGRAPWDALRAILRYRGWNWRERLALLQATISWTIRGFRCPQALTVAELTAALPARVKADLIGPLCVAALNTPSELASAQVFLRVLHDALLAADGASHLLLPQVDLGALFPEAAGVWLQQRGAEVSTGTRVLSLAQTPAGWQVNDRHFDATVLACPPAEAARLARPTDPDWAQQAARLPFEPIVTVYARAAGARLPEPMLALKSNEQLPAQFVFDRGQLGGPDGLLAFVISGASRWVERGTAALESAVLAQAREALPQASPQRLEIMKTVVEKRATFLCTPSIRRPRSDIAPGLQAAGDYVAGPYPATLEGAVRSGIAAVRSLVA